MAKDFYDKVAKKFGNYHTLAKSIDEFLQGDPEEVFKQKLLEVSGKDKIVLDVGCADGRFTLLIAPHFKKVIAIDISKGMLNAAKRNQKEKNTENVEFLKQDVHKMTFDPNSFDVIYSRRGPNDFPAYYKVLKRGGHFFSIEIGENDTKEIKEVFGRGQGYGKWNESAREREKNALENEGFEVIYSGDFYYNEYYLSYNDLDIFLQGVPIFEDYDSEKDKKYLKKYIRNNQKEKGIDLPRHRFVLVAIKK